MYPNIIPIINYVLKPYNLKWDNSEFVYLVNMSFGSSKILISADFKDVLKYLELPEDLLTLDIEYAYHLIANCKQFSKHSFKKVKHSKPYDQFLSLISDFKYKSKCITITQKEVLKTLKNSLKLDISSMLPPVEYSNAVINNKFNGNLVRNWAGVDKGYEIYSLMLKFRAYMYNTHHIKFINYLAVATPKRIRLDFLTFHTNYIIKLSKCNSNTLPF